MELQTLLQSLGMTLGFLDGLPPGPRTVAAIKRYEESRGQPQTGNLDVPTWPVLLQSDPLPVRWTNGGAVAAGSGGRVALPPPRSAKLPSVRDEIPPPAKRAR